MEKVLKTIQEYLGKAKEYLRPFISMCVVIWMSISGAAVPASLDLVLTDYKPQDTNVKIISETGEGVNIAKIDKKGVYIKDDFIVMSCSDLHLEGNYRLDNATIDNLYRQILARKPDLIVITGDIITSWRTEETAKEFGDFMQRVGIYWAYTLGEGDAASNASITRKALAELFSGYSTCLTKVGSDSIPGYGNSYINIMNSKDEVRQSVFLFDTGSKPDTIEKFLYDIDPEQNSAGFLKKEHVSWYNSKMKEINSTYGHTQALLFMHSPILDYETILTSPEAKRIYGVKRESSAVTTYKTSLASDEFGIYCARAIYCGHCHLNDICVFYNGMTYVCNQPAGYNGKQLSSDTSISSENWIQGVTITAVSYLGEIAVSQHFNRDLPAV